MKYGVIPPTSVGAATEVSCSEGPHARCAREYDPEMYSSTLLLLSIAAWIRRCVRGRVVVSRGREGKSTHLPKDDSKGDKYGTMGLPLKERKSSKSPLELY